jgi:hypothetical protein
MGWIFVGEIERFRGREMTIENKASWEEVRAATPGTIFVDIAQDGFRFAILRGRSALCAYLGIPLNHPLAWRKYKSIDVRVHGGLTYDAPGGDGYLPEGYYWYGWDHGHAGDKVCFAEEVENILASTKEESPIPSTDSICWIEMSSGPSRWWR